MAGLSNGVNKELTKIAIQEDKKWDFGMFLIILQKLRNLTNDNLKSWQF